MWVNKNHIIRKSVLQRSFWYILSLVILAIKSGKKREKTTSKFKNVDTIFSSQKFNFKNKLHWRNCSHHLQHQSKLYKNCARHQIFLISLTLSWRRPLSYRNYSTDLICKWMGWFLYDNGLPHERVKSINNYLTVSNWSLYYYCSEWRQKIQTCFTLSL